MENIKRRFNRSYILLESLIALSLLMIISTVILTEISQSRQRLNNINQEIEELNVGKMALDMGQNELAANGVSIRIEEDDQHFVIFDEKGQEKFALKILNRQN